jgi:hypothetical protein
MRALATGARSAAILAVLLGMGSAACRTEPEAGRPQGEFEGIGTVAAELASDSQGAGSPRPPIPAAGAPGTERPFRNFELPPDPGQTAEVVLHPVRIDNGSNDTVTVWASAGAEPVFLERVPPAGSFRVNLIAPEGALRIDWRSVDDRPRGSTPVEPPTDEGGDSVRILRLGP